MSRSDLDSLHQHSLYGGEGYGFLASVTESLTGIVQNGSGVLTFHKKPIKVTELPGSPALFKPGLVYTAYVSTIIIRTKCLLDGLGGGGGNGEPYFVLPSFLTCATLFRQPEYTTVQYFSL